MMAERNDSAEQYVAQRLMALYSLAHCQECAGEGFLIEYRLFGLWPVQRRCGQCHGLGMIKKLSSKEESQHA